MSSSEAPAIIQRIEMGNTPLEDDTDATMRRIADFIKDQVGPEYAFFAMVSPWGNQKVGNYISNAKRPEMIIALREQANALEAGLDIPNPADLNKH